MKVLISERISPHKYKTPEGYLICVDSVLARTGKQTYKRNELWNDGDDTDIDVDRTPEEVFSQQTLASFENKPITVEHPNEDVNSENFKDYSVGFVRDVHKGTVNGQDVILGTLVIQDAQTIEEIENGEHTDLSCGYDCDIADDDNPQQRNIRGNHIALCECGRAGNAHIVDSVKKVNDKLDLFYKGFLIEQTFDKLLKIYNRDGEFIGTRETLEECKKRVDEYIKNFELEDSVNDSDLSLLREYFNEKQPNKRMELGSRLRSMGYEEGVSGVNSKELMWVRLNGKRYEVKNSSSVSPLDSVIASMSYNEILNAIENAKRNEGFDVILNGGKFIRWTAFWDNGFIYTVWSSNNPNKNKFNNIEDAKKYAILLLNEMKSNLKDTKEPTEEEIKEFANRYGFSYVDAKRALMEESNDFHEKMQHHQYDTNTMEEVTNNLEKNFDKFKKEKMRDETIRTPRGTFALSEKTEEELKNEGYGYWFTADVNGKSYRILNNGTLAFAVKDSIKDSFNNVRKVAKLFCAIKNKLKKGE